MANNYSFNVEIWEEDDKVLFGVSEEFESAEGKEFIPLSWGEADSYEAAAEAAWEVVREFIRNNV